MQKKIYFSVRWGGGKFETFCGPDKTLVCVLYLVDVYIHPLFRTQGGGEWRGEREKEERGGACSGGMNTPEFFFSFFLYFFGSVSRQDAVESRDRAPFSSLSLSLSVSSFSLALGTSHIGRLLFAVLFSFSPAPGAKQSGRTFYILQFSFSKKARKTLCVFPSTSQVDRSNSYIAALKTKQNEKKL